MRLTILVDSQKKEIDSPSPIIIDSIIRETLFNASRMTIDLSNEYALMDLWIVSQNNNPIKILNK